MSRLAEEEGGDLVAGRVALPVPGLPPANEPLPNVPRGWWVLWCPGCGYSVTVTEAEREDWRDSHGWGCAHDCQVEAPLPNRGTRSQPKSD